MHRRDGTSHNEAAVIYMLISSHTSIFETAEHSLELVFSVGVGLTFPRSIGKGVKDKAVRSKDDHTNRHSRANHHRETSHSWAITYPRAFKLRI